MTIWPPKPGTLRRPAYRSLAEAVVAAVNAGLLSPGDRLPTHRQMAFDLGLSVQTVSRAYDELIRRGVVNGEVGRGSFIRRPQAEAATPFAPDRQFGGDIDLSLLKPVLEQAHLNAMRDVLAALSENFPTTAISSFRPSSALRAYQPAAERWLKRCGLPLERQSVLLTNGATAAMTVALMTVAQPGDLILAEALSHHTLKTLTRYLGMRVAGLATDEQGILPESLAAACARDPVKALYVMPSGLNPQAAMMGTRRRGELAEIARAHDIAIIENDAWGPLQPGRPAPVSALARERSFYFTSLTKCILPGLRIGFLVVPETRESAAASRHLVTNWMATPLMAEIAARWINDGTADDLLQRQRAALAERNALAERILHGLPFRASINGMHVWLPLEPPWRDAVLVEHARINGVAIAPGTTFALDGGERRPGVRICLGGESRENLERGLEVISRLLRSAPEPVLMAI
ncbi:GntR family transcriptional regulator [Maritimibacter sp. 55A14]|nr:GntR family transcriptional regulator [Maritimibacter sp. 55A14]